MKVIIFIVILIIFFFILFKKKLIKEPMITYNKIPKPYNCKFKPLHDTPIYQTIGQNVIFNIRKDHVSPGYYSQIEEISNTKFNKLLKSIINTNKLNTTNMKFEELSNLQYNYWKGLQKAKIDFKIYNIIVDFLLFLINTKIQKIDFFKFKKNFQIFKNSLISVSKFNNYFQYAFEIEIYRKYKVTGFSIFALSYYNINNKKIYFKELTITGNFVSYYSFNKNLDFDSNWEPEYANIWWKYPYKTFRESGNDFNKFIKKKSVIKSILKERKTMHKDNSFYKNYNLLCYDKSGDIKYNYNNRIICESNIDFFGGKKKEGVWDKECIKNNECPFFKANKNYKNSAGGCHNGSCILPINMKLFGYRHFRKDKKYKPFCYNCPNGSIGNCCDKQKNKALYPYLKSPDYAFIGDINYRYKYRNELKKKGLKWKFNMS